MKTSRRWLWLLVPAALGAGLFTFTSAYASGPFCGGFRGHHAAASSPAEIEDRLDHKIEYLLDAVDATAAQRKQADGVVKKLSPELFELMGEGRVLRGELKSALLAEKLSPARIEELRTQLDALGSRLVDTSMDGVVAVAELLTPAQRRLIADKLARMHL